MFLLNSQDRTTLVLQIMSVSDMNPSLGEIIQGFYKCLFQGNIWVFYDSHSQT